MVGQLEFRRFTIELASPFSGLLNRRGVFLENFRCPTLYFVASRPSLSILSTPWWIFGRIAPFLLNFLNSGPCTILNCTVMMAMVDYTLRRSLALKEIVLLLTITKLPFRVLYGTDSFILRILYPIGTNAWYSSSVTCFLWDSLWTTSTQ